LANSSASGGSLENAIRTPTAGFRRLLRDARMRQSDYRFLTPRKKKTEFRKQNSESSQNRGVKNRQLKMLFNRRACRRQNPVVSVTRR
jgi:hypothetical protein